MSLRRSLRIALGLIVTAIMLLGALTIPGLRHRHAGGERAHSHHGHSHTHSHHGHSHTHSHSHGSHTHHHHAETPGEVAATTAHIHVTILGFELTLPDFFGDVDEPVAETSAEQGERQLPVVAGQVAFVPPHLPAQVIQFVLDLKCPLPDWVCFPADGAPWSSAALAALPLTGCEAPKPLEPPPRTV